MRTKNIFIVARYRKASGGVTSTARALLRIGVSDSVARPIDWSLPSGFISLIWTAIRGRRSTDIVLFNVSARRTFLIASLLARVTRARSVIFLHGREPTAWLETSCLARLMAYRGADYWVSNPEFGRVLSETVGQHALVVSPFSGSTLEIDEHSPPCSVDWKSSTVKLIAFDRCDVSLYRPDIAVSTLTRLRETGVDAALLIVQYGGRGEQRFRSYAQHSYFCTDLTEAQVNRLIRDADWLLRPTTSDGDSIVVRTALELGTFVLASDCTLRPAGVALAAIDEFASVAATGAWTLSSENFGCQLDVAAALLAGEFD